MGLCHFGNNLLINDSDGQIKLSNIDNFTILWLELFVVKSTKYKDEYYE